MEFYKDVSLFYNEMTRFKSRINNEKEVLKTLSERLKLKSVIDAGCGSGIHAIAMAMSGLKVTGVDKTISMIELAEKNANRYNCHVDWITADIVYLDKYFNNKRDAVLCLGNTLPHVLSGDDVRQMIQSFQNIINPGGFIILQLLNYSKILKKRERVFGVHKFENKEYIRFYDFIDPLVQFNILLIDWDNTPPSFKIVTSQLYPYTRNEILKLIGQFRFSQVNCFGNLMLEPFDEENSNDLVLVLQMPEY